MFKVDIIERVGVPPMQLAASQVVVRLPDGTPVSIAALFGSDESVLVSHCDDPKFNEDLQSLGINQTVITEKLEIRN